MLPTKRNQRTSMNSCILIGKAEIDIPFPSEEERSVSVEYIFGNTEISMTATEDLEPNVKQHINLFELLQKTNIHISLVAKYIVFFKLY